MLLIPCDYPYVPLDAKSLLMHLLILFPGNFNDCIECTLINTSLSEPLRYEALSYRWGDHKKRRPVSLDCRLFLATESLEIALRYLRSHDTSRVLWINAICIKQADDQERSQQVGLMGDIYRGA